MKIEIGNLTLYQIRDICLNETDCTHCKLLKICETKLNDFIPSSVSPENLEKIIEYKNPI